MRWLRWVYWRIVNRVLGPRQDGAQAVADHLVNCTDAKAAIVVDGNADFEVARLLAAGWILQERVDYVAGKRIRFMSPPGSSTPFVTTERPEGDEAG